jgi:hypothetical protein
MDGSTRTCEIEPDDLDILEPMLPVETMTDRSGRQIDRKTKFFGTLHTPV